MNTDQTMKTALITGVTGQDGSYLTELLLSKGYLVVGTHRNLLVKKHDVDNIYLKNITHIFNNENFIVKYGNVLEPTSLWKLITKYKPDEIYNLAAQSHVNLSFKSSEITTETNALGALSLLNIIIDVVPNTKFFQASSSDMYGYSTASLLNEDDVFKPNTPYGCGKLLTHHMVNIYRNVYNLHASCGICFNHESPRRSGNFATQKIVRGTASIKLGLQDKLLLGNLDVKRDWGHARDYVDAMWLMLQQDKPDDYVIATGKSHSLRSFVEKMFKHAQLDIEKHVEIDQNLYRDYDTDTISGDSSKIKEKLGWESKTTFDELAMEMYDSALEELK